MPAPVQTEKVSVQEYLNTAYRPDCDYVDGDLQERNVGTFDHGAVQFALARYFFDHRREWAIRVALDTRVQVAATRFRVPDLSVLSGERPVEQIITHPPLICIEVLSPEDTLHRLRERLDDYRQFGVVHCWMVDPATHGGYEALAGGLAATVDFAVPGTAIRLSLSALFSNLE